MNIKLEHLRVFAAVVETGTLVDAGRKLSRTPSAISMTLNQIEDDLGDSLFEGDRKARLTEAGSYLYKKTKRLLDDHAAMMIDIERFVKGEEGIIKIAAVPSAVNKLLSKSIALFKEEHQHIEIELRDSDSANIAELIKTGVVDIGIASLNMDAANISSDFLLEDPFLLVCSSDNPLARKGEVLEWSDINIKEFISNGLCKNIDDPSCNLLTQNAALTIHNTTSLLSFVKQKIGITILPELAAIDSQNIVARPIRNFSATRKLWVLTRTGEKLNPAASRLLKQIRKTASELMG